jgi:hypothetical protein
MPLQNSLVIRRQAWSANFTEKSHLYNRMLAKPTLMQDTIRRVFASELYAENPLTRKLEGINAVRTIPTDEWTWYLRGAHVRPSTYIGLAAGAPLGANRMEFDLTLDLDVWLPGDILTPGDYRYQVRIQSGPIKSGTRSVYRVRLMTDDDTLAVPVAFLKPGVKWGKLFSKYEEGGHQSGSTQYAMPFELRSRLSKVRKEMSMTRDAHNEVLTMQIPGDDGKLYGAWTDYAEAVFWQEFYKEIEYIYWYSRNTTKVPGATGRTVQSGPGVLELLEESHTFAFNQFNGKILQEFLSDIQTNRLTPGSSERRVVIGTGEYGLRLIHDAGNNMIKENGFQVLNNFTVNNTQSEFHSNAVSVGYQVTQLKFPNGTVVDLMHVPQFDDPRINNGIDPITGYPYESMRMVILDLNGQGASSNIKMVKKENGMDLRYIAGLVKPRGLENSVFTAHAGEYYEMHALDHCGIQIDDVTACGMLYPIRQD